MRNSASDTDLFGFSCAGRMFLALLALALIVAGCHARRPATAARACEPPGDATVTDEVVDEGGIDDLVDQRELLDVALGELIRPAADLATYGTDGWEYGLATQADLDQDGFSEKVWVIAHVSVDAARGEPIWEDGQEWQVYIEEENGDRTYLYAQMIQLGQLDVSVTHEVQPTVLIQATQPAQSHTYEFVYDGPQAVEARTLVARHVARRPTPEGVQEKLNPHPPSQEKNPASPGGGGSEINPSR